jgi:single-strand DNA-binding protein
MSGSVNKVILIGNVGKDPEIRTTQDGVRIANFSVATSERWRDKSSGEQREKTEWHRVVVFNEGLAKIVEQYVRKGTSLYVEGALQTRKWTDQSGQERYSTEIVMQKYRGEITLLGSKPDGQQSGGSSDSYGGGSSNVGVYGAPAMGGPSDLDDEIPF